jgi:hypothetical protein
MPDKERLLELALKGLQAERAKIDNEIAEIKGQLGSRTMSAAGGQTAGVTDAQPKKKKTMSAAARKKISESMKRRYAEMRRAVKKMG